MSTSCLFCNIAVGVEKATIVFEDESCVAFLDKRPLFPGHTLLIPKKHLMTLYDLPTELRNIFFSDLQLIGQAIEKAMTAEGSFIAMNNRISQSVPHLHAHIVPRNTKDGLKGFFWPRQQYVNAEQINTVQAKIKTEINRLQKTHN